jgi:outer membrane protein assembly factor BamB
MNRRWIFLAAVAVTCFSFVGAAADWPQWRGPQRTGISTETGLLQEWPAGGPKLLWRVNNVGSGFSTPSVVGDRVYLLSNEGLANEYVRALNASDGKQVWSTRIGKVGNADQEPSYPGARSTPTIEGDVLYALGSDGDLVALDPRTGQVRWKKNLRTDFGGVPGTWAYSESPLVDGDALVVTPGGRTSLVALNKKTGEAVWRSVVPGGEAAGYASVAIVQTGTVKQYVTFLEKGVVGVDARTGAFLWRDNRTAEGSAANIPTPVVSGGQVYNATSQGGGALVKLAVAAGKVTAQPAYHERRLPGSNGGSVVIDGHLYGTNATGLLCVEFMSGAVKWQERGIGTAALAYADGRLYLRGENGDVSLVEPSPAGYREKGRFTPPGAPDRGQAKAWPHPVVANGRLYVRDLSVLWAYDVRRSP